VSGDVVHPCTRHGVLSPLHGRYRLLHRHSITGIITHATTPTMGFEKYKIKEDANYGCKI